MSYTLKGFLGQLDELDILFRYRRLAKGTPPCNGQDGQDRHGWADAKGLEDGGRLPCLRLMQMSFASLKNSKVTSPDGHGPCLFAFLGRSVDLLEPSMVIGAGAI